MPLQCQVWEIVIRQDRSSTSLICFATSTSEVPASSLTHHCASICHAQPSSDKIFGKSVCAIAVQSMAESQTHQNVTLLSTAHRQPCKIFMQRLKIEEALWHKLATPACWGLCCPAHRCQGPSMAGMALACPTDSTSCCYPYRQQIFWWLRYLCPPSFWACMPKELFQHFAAVTSRGRNIWWLTSKDTYCSPDSTLRTSKHPLRGCNEQEMKVNTKKHNPGDLLCDNWCPAQWPAAQAQLADWPWSCRHGHLFGIDGHGQIRLPFCEQTLELECSADSQDSLHDSCPDAQDEIGWCMNFDI